MTSPLRSFFFAHPSRLIVDSIDKHLLSRLSSSNGKTLQYSNLISSLSFKIPRFFYLPFTLRYAARNVTRVTKYMEFLEVFQRLTTSPPSRSIDTGSYSLLFKNVVFTLQFNVHFSALTVSLSSLLLPLFSSIEVAACTYPCTSRNYSANLSESPVT